MTDAELDKQIEKFIERNRRPGAPGPSGATGGGARLQDMPLDDILDPTDRMHERLRRSDPHAVALDKFLDVHFARERAALRPPPPGRQDAPAPPEKAPWWDAMHQVDTAVDTHVAQQRAEQQARRQQRDRLNRTEGGSK